MTGVTARNAALDRLRGATRRFRSLTPEQEDAVRVCIEDGVKPADLAAVYDVSVRTIYRTLRRATRRTSHVVLGDYHATFELTDEGPIQLEPWRAA